MVKTPRNVHAVKQAPTCGDSGGVTLAGKPCRSSISLSPENGLCRVHDPARAKEVLEMRRAGAHARGEAARRAKAALPDDVPRAPKTLQDAVEWSSWAIRAVATGEIDPRVGHEIGYLVNSFKAAVEIGGVSDEERARSIRDHLEELRKASYVDPPEGMNEDSK